jgi:hypothetical protein
MTEEDIAHPARVYDHWLGGKDNFEPDLIASAPPPARVRVVGAAPDLDHDCSHETLLLP